MSYSNQSIGVVIPVHNRAELLAETLQSVVEQTYRPTQVVVVDDGSTEDIASIVRRFSEVTYIRTERSGTVMARTRAVQELKSDWIAFCDSDDIWEKDKLELQINFLLENPIIDYCFTNFRILSYQKNVVGELKWLLSVTTKFDQAPKGYWERLPVMREVSDDYLILTNKYYKNIATEFQPIFPSSVMLSAQKFNRIGGFDVRMSEKLTEDLEFTLRCVADGKIGCIVKPLVRIRKHPLNHSGDLVKMLRGDIAILDFALEHHPFAKQYEKEIRHSQHRRAVSLASELFARRRFDLLDEPKSYIVDEELPLATRVKLLIGALPETPANFLADWSERLMELRKHH